MKKLILNLCFTVVLSGNAFAFENKQLKQQSDYKLGTEGETELEKEKRLSAEYLLKMKSEINAFEIEEGVIIKPIFKSNSTVYPSDDDNIKFSYNLFDREGKLLEESFSNDEIADVSMNKFLKCWKIALPYIPTGSIFKISCPSDTAWGDTGVPGYLKPGAAVTFRVFLADVHKI